MTTITDADREAVLAAPLTCKCEHCVKTFSEIFARHRELGERIGLEKAAWEAEREMPWEVEPEARGVGQEGEPWWRPERRYRPIRTGKPIADSIRALINPPEKGEI